MVLLLGVVIIADAIEPSKYLNRYKRLEIHRHGQKPTILWYFRVQKEFAWEITSRVVHYSPKMSYAMKY